MFLSHYFYIIIKFLCMFDEDRHGALYRSSFDCLVDAVLHVTGAHAVLPPHLLRHPGNPMAKLRGGSEVRSGSRLHKFGKKAVFFLPNLNEQSLVSLFLTKFG